MKTKKKITAITETLDALQFRFDWSETEYEVIESLLKQRDQEWIKRIKKALPEKKSVANILQRHFCTGYNSCRSEFLSRLDPENKLNLK